MPPSYKRKREKVCAGVQVGVFQNDWKMTICKWAYLSKVTRDTTWRLVVSINVWSRALSHLYKRSWPSLGRSNRIHSLFWSVRWSVVPSVIPLCLLKNRVSQLFLATARSYTELNDRYTCFAVCLSVHPYVNPYVTHSHTISASFSLHVRTQSERIVARSGLFFP